MTDDGDAYAGDPYRGGTYRDVGARCPRCNEALEGSATGALTCPQACGDWLSKGMLRGRVALENLAAREPDVGSLIGRPFPPATCALCPATMDVRIHRGVSFDLCLDHGVWLDRGEREDFVRAFGVHAEIPGAVRAPRAPERPRPYEEEPAERDARERHELAAWLASLTAPRRD